MGPVPASTYLELQTIGTYFFYSKYVGKIATALPAELVNAQSQIMNTGAGAMAANMNSALMGAIATAIGNSNITLPLIGTVQVANLPGFNAIQKQADAAMLKAPKFMKFQFK